MAIEAYKLELGGVHGRGWTLPSMVFLTDNSGPEPALIKAKDLIDDFNADKLAPWRSLFPNEYALEWIRARRISVGKGKSRNREYPGLTGQGTRAGDTSSLALAPVIKLICGMASDTQGRIFLPCVAEADFASNTYAPAYVTVVTTVFGGLVNWTGTVSGSTWQLGVFSPKLATVVEVVAVALSDVIGNIKRRRTPA